MEKELEIRKRFVSFLEFLPNGCIIWKGCLKGNGYGCFWLNGKSLYAHRFAYQTYKGNLIKGLVLDHICRNRKCVNFEHLRQVTQRENVLENSNSIQAKNFKKKKCQNGHLLIGNNLVKDNSRRCRICWNNYQGEYKRKKKLFDKKISTAPNV